MKPCPQHIAEPLLEILRLGLLAIRAAGFANRGDLCAIHADHLHNLPHLFDHYSDDLLLFYWQVERDKLIQKANPGRYFEAPWSQLEMIIAELKVNSPKPKEVAGAI
jgi:hypothetical protein